jgi:hypothetical protein
MEKQKALNVKISHLQQLSRVEDKDTQAKGIESLKHSSRTLSQDTVKGFVMTSFRLLLVILIGRV